MLRSQPLGTTADPSAARKPLRISQFRAALPQENNALDGAGKQHPLRICLPSR
jgi:hypothetical protein